MGDTDDNREVATTVTYLEMRRPPALASHRPPPLDAVLMRLEEPSVGFYRYLYDAVGRQFCWVDRKRLSDEALSQRVFNDRVSVTVAYVGGAPAGYFEIGRRSDKEVWLEYFGIIAGFRRRGLGKWLLGEALLRAWALTPQVVRVETCTLDDPAALGLYQRMGFCRTASRDKIMRLP